jgi:pilus assembly protein CpaF
MARRRVTAISEITGMEQDVITMQDIYLFERTGLTPAHRHVRARAGCRLRSGCHL